MLFAFDFKKSSSSKEKEIKLTSQTSFVKGSFFMAEAMQAAPKGSACGDFSTKSVRQMTFLFTKNDCSAKKFSSIV